MRGQKVMFVSDLADLYGVNARTLNQAVSRNKSRFPDDFMFCISQEEAKDLRPQITIPLTGKPRVFTESGVLMLAYVLKSRQAIAVSIKLVRLHLVGHSNQFKIFNEIILPLLKAPNTRQKKDTL